MVWSLCASFKENGTASSHFSFLVMLNPKYLPRYAAFDTSAI